MRILLIVVILGGVITLGSLTLTNPSIIQNAATVIQSAQDDQYAICTQTHSTEPTSAFSFTKAKINTDTTSDVLYQFKDNRECGNAGCVTYICLSTDTSFAPVPFGYAAQSVTVLETANNDMHDIMLNNDPALTLLWNGNQYGLNAENVERNELEFLEQIDI